MKLKTLKDFEIVGTYKKGNYSHHSTNLVLMEDIRLEAINWMKAMVDNPCETCPVELLWEQKGYKGCPAGDPNGCGVYYAFMLFFNITKADLEANPNSPSSGLRG